MPTPAAHPHTVEGLLRVIEAHDSELALLKLQLRRRVRAEFGTSSEQLAAQVTLIDSEVVLPAQPVAAAGKPAAANAPAIDRSLPAHLPREAHVHSSEATATCRMLRPASACSHSACLILLMRTLRVGIASPGHKAEQPMPRSVTQDIPTGVRDQSGTLSAFSLERRPPSRRNAVRHPSGTVYGMAWHGIRIELNRQHDQAIVGASRL